MPTAATTGYHQALGADTSGKWALQSPAGNTECGPISSGGPGVVRCRTGFRTGAGRDDQDFQASPSWPVRRQHGPSTVGGYTVDASSNSTKADDFYVQDTWVDAQGRTNYRFSPIAACSTNCPTRKIYLLETLAADISLANLGGKQGFSLRYDDSPPFLDGDLKPMPYCNIDPRQGSPGDHRRAARNRHVVHRREQPARRRR